LKAISAEYEGNFISFGLEPEADFYASDILLDGETNFKINHKGSAVPIWLKNGTKEGVFSALATAACGITFGLNMVEISQALKKYQAS
jgi:UDP-N-acetylmuramyl pentapeptide synthase